MTEMTPVVLREPLTGGPFLAVPGLQDMIAAVIGNKVGFEAVYGTAYWLTASSLGLADAGIASYTRMLDRMATLARVSDAAVIADADTGYGGLLNVHHAAKGYDEAGIAAISWRTGNFPRSAATRRSSG